jgi:hypothetical protein
VAAASPDASAEKSRADTSGDTAKREEEGSLDTVTPRRRAAAASLDIYLRRRGGGRGRNQEWRWLRDSGENERVADGSLFLICAKSYGLAACWALYLNGL